MTGGWPAPRLHAVFGCPVADIDRAALKRVVDASVPEDVDLEFKSQMYGDGDKDKFEAAKDVAAMADRGGAIVIGVRGRDAGGQPDLVDVSLADGVEERLRQIVAARVNPLPRFDVRAIPASPSGGIGQWLITVPPSPSSPHAVVEGRRLLYVTRHGATTRELAESEVAERYARRFRAFAEQDDRARTVLAEGVESLYTTGRSWLAMALAPTWAGDVTPDQATLERHRVWCETWQQSAPQSKIDVSATRTQTFGFRRLVVTNDMQFSGKSSYGHYEVHADGAGFAAVALGQPIPEATPQPTGIENRDRDHVIDEAALAHAVLGMLDLLAAQATTFAGAGGDAAVAVSLVVGGDDVVDRRPLWLVQDHYIDATFFGVRRVPGSRSIRTGSTTERRVVLSSLATDAAQRVVVARGITLDLLSQFGQGGWAGFTADGAVRVAPFGRDRNLMRQWATFQGVPIAP